MSATVTHVADTVPYPWPYDGRGAADAIAFVVCGAQHQLVDRSTDVVAVGDRLDAVADAVRGGGGQVLWVRHGRREAWARPSRSARTLGRRPTPQLPTRDTAGWQLMVEVAPSDVVVDCEGWDGCFGSGLDHLLRIGGLRSIFIGGFASEITVDSTIRTLNDRGHECLVLTDGCAPVVPALGARAHASVTMSGGIFGAIGSTDAVLSYLHSLNNRLPRGGLTKETSP